MSVVGCSDANVSVHYTPLWQFLRKMGLPPDRADDVAQGAFLIALERLPNIMTGSECAYLHATAIRIVHGMRRRSQREVLEADLDLGRSPSPSPEDAADQKRARELLEALLEGIEFQSRTVFLSFEVEGLTIPEIAASLAISRAAATCRLRQARRRFRALVRSLNVV
jgi:RNA polymerase sigma-70 factor (ECF subfamily)